MIKSVAVLVAQPAVESTVIDVAPINFCAVKAAGEGLDPAVASLNLSVVAIVLSSFYIILRICLQSLCLTPKDQQSLGKAFQRFGNQ